MIRVGLCYPSPHKIDPCQLRVPQSPTAVYEAINRLAHLDRAKAPSKAAQVWVGGDSVCSGLAPSS